MSRRILNRVKSNRVRKGLGTPSRNEGNDGDLTLRRTNSGEVLYLKTNNRWAHIGQLQRVGAMGRAKSPAKHLLKSTSLELASSLKIDTPPRNLELTAAELKLTGRDQGDFVLNIDGGQFWIYDDTAKHFLFDCDNTAFRIFDDQDAGDFFDILVSQHGATSIRTVDDDGNDDAHMTLDADGDVILDPVSGITKFYKAGDTDDLCTLTVAANGATTIATADSDGVVGHLTLDAAGDIALSADGDQITMDDGQGNTRFTFNLDSTPEIDVNGTFTLDCSLAMTIEASQITLDCSSDMHIDAGGGCINFLDDDVKFAELRSSGTYGNLEIFNPQDNGDWSKLSTGAAGITTFITNDDSGGNAAHLTMTPEGDLVLDPATHLISCLDNAVGFTQEEPAFNATDTIITFSTTGNKAKLTLTDNCADIHFKFPTVSGNFICVLLQDGTGGRTISNWKTQDAAGNAGAGNSGLVLWAGGSDPTNTETADKADIASFYWDADNEIAYGTYTYNF